MERLLEVLRLGRAVEVPGHPAAGHPERPQVPRVAGGVPSLQHGAMQQLEDGDYEEAPDDDQAAVAAVTDAKYDERLCQVPIDIFTNVYCFINIVLPQLNMQTLFSFTSHIVFNATQIDLH